MTLQHDQGETMSVLPLLALQQHWPKQILTVPTAALRPVHNRENQTVKHRTYCFSFLKK